ncbi:hypothetical protein EJB05_43460, partial [Eragrostis curvula]
MSRFPSERFVSSLNCSREMSISTEVRTEGRFAQWEVAVAPRHSYLSSNIFTLGNWTWRLNVEKDHVQTTYMNLTRLGPRDLDAERTDTICFKATRFPQSLCSHPRTVAHGGNFRWAIPGFDSGRLLVEIKLNATKRNVAGAPLGSQAEAMAQSGVALMLNEGILTDITVNAVGGSVGAHRAVLASRSPVFKVMFSHDLRERLLSTLDIPDMSFAACRAFIRYLYGFLREGEFLEHRSELLSASDKYDIPDLKKACEKSMVHDIDAENVLERLQMARLYGLSELTGTCMRLLVNFKKIYEISDDFEDFVNTADVDLVIEVIQSCRQAQGQPTIYNPDVRSALTSGWATSYSVDGTQPSQESTRIGGKPIKPSSFEIRAAQVLRSRSTWRAANPYPRDTDAAF